MKKQTKPYITLRDRVFRGKDWWTSFRIYKNIRRLTEEEAKPFLEEGTIQEVIMPKYGKDIFRIDNGRMICNKCESKAGFYIKKRPFGKTINVFTCADCGIREIKEVL